MSKDEMLTTALKLLRRAVDDDLIAVRCCGCGCCCVGDHSDGELFDREVCDFLAKCADNGEYGGLKL